MCSAVIAYTGRLTTVSSARFAKNLLLRYVVWREETKLIYSWLHCYFLCHLSICHMDFDLVLIVYPGRWASRLSFILQHFRNKCVQYLATRHFKISYKEYTIILTYITALSYCIASVFPLPSLFLAQTTRSGTGTASDVIWFVNFFIVFNRKTTSYNGVGWTDYETLLLQGT